jgi:carbonic anhydrase
MKSTALVSGILLTQIGMACASDKPHWEYSGHAGPEHWGVLSPEFVLCDQAKTRRPLT